MANLKYIGKNILNHTLEIKKGNVSGSATSTGSFGQLVIGNGGDIILTEDQRIYFESDKGSWIESDGTDRFRLVAGGSQMLVLDQDDGRAVFGYGVNVFIGSNNNQIPSNELEVDGTISGSGILSIAGNITASGNISGSGNIIGKRATFDNAVSASKVYASEGFYHSDDVAENTHITFPTGDKVQITAGDVNFIHAHQVDADINKLIINDDNTDTDIIFRGAVGSNNNLLRLDASEMKVGVGTGVPTETLTVEGNISASGALMGISHITASGNISASNLYLDEYIYHSGEPTQTYIRITDKRFRINAGGINYLDMNDNAGPPRDITFNDGGNNVDLTIKGSSNNPLFKTDASANRIGTHGKGTPAVAFHIGGSELRVDGNISGSSTGIGSFGSVFTATHITASGNLEIAGNIQTSENISGSSATFNNAVSASKVYAADGFYHSDNSDNTYLKFPTGDKVQINAGDVNFIYAWQKDSDVNKLIFNDDNTDTDIVFRSANGSNNKLLYLDASADKVGIKTGAPTEALTVEGNISASGALMGVTHVTASGNVEVTGNISGSVSTTGSFGRVEIADDTSIGGDILLDEDQRIYFEADKKTWIESNGANLIRTVANNSQMLLLDHETGNRAVFGNGTKVFIGANNNELPSNELEVVGTISGSGILSIDGNITGSENLEIAGNVSGSITSTGSFGAGQFSGNVTPKTDNDMDLGSSAKRWANIYDGDME